MDRYLDICTAAFAFVASIFWFLSARGSLPLMGSYWDRAPPNDPFYVDVKFSATMNRWAAGLSGLSALCMSLKLFF